MTTTKISLHRALAELKLIDSKITKLTEDLEPTGVKQKGKLINNLHTDEHFATKAQSTFQSITALIDRKVKLKAAIVEANAKTFLTIGDREMSIADAITYKSIIDYKKRLMESLKSQYASTKKNMETRNMAVEQNLQRVLEATFGKDNVKITKDDMDAVRKPFLESNEWVLVDPLKIEETLARLEKEILEFESEVDAALSEINALTQIEV